MPPQDTGIQPDGSFRFRVMGTARTREHLADLIRLASASDLAAHIRPGRHDIADWVETVLEDFPLAQRIRKTTDPNEIADLLSERKVAYPGPGPLPLMSTVKPTPWIEPARPFHPLSWYDMACPFVIFVVALLAAPILMVVFDAILDGFSWWLSFRSHPVGQGFWWLSYVLCFLGFVLGGGLFFEDLRLVKLVLLFSIGAAGSTGVLSVPVWLLYTGPQEPILVLRNLLLGVVPLVGILPIYFSLLFHFIARLLA